VSGYAPRALEDSVRPRRFIGVSGRPLNFTVRPQAGRRHFSGSAVGGKAMKRYGIYLGLFVAGAAAGIVGSQELLAGSGGYSTKMLLRTDLENLPGQEVLIFASDWPPGSKLPMHTHPDAHEFDYVVEGEQTFHFQGGELKTVKSGEVLYTPPNTPHFGENATQKSSKVIVFRIKPKSRPISAEVK
jgi:quercetin dioxygenase-like cupin family protein